MKIVIHEEPLTCDGCGDDVKAVVDTPTQGGGPWGHFCQRCVDSWAYAFWRDSKMTTMLVNSKADVF